MTTIKEAAAEFLTAKRVAVTGVSRHPQGHGSNVVYQRLRERGFNPIGVDLSELLKGGGSVKCCTLEVRA